MTVEQIVLVLNYKKGAAGIYACFISFQDSEALVEVFRAKTDGVWKIRTSHAETHFTMQAYPDYDDYCHLLYLQGTDSRRDNKDFSVLQSNLQGLCEAVAKLNGRKNVVDPFLIDMGKIY